jgi:hypothetical protein
MIPTSALPVVSDLVRDPAQPLAHNRLDYDRVLQLIGNARVVPLGEISRRDASFTREQPQCGSVQSRSISERSLGQESTAGGSSARRY